MKKILKRGYKEITECKTCGCEFSYDKEDVEMKDTDNYKGYKQYVVCPQCCCEVVLLHTK